MGIFDDDPLVIFVNSDTFGYISLFILVGIPTLFILYIIITEYFRESNRHWRKQKREDKKALPIEYAKLRETLKQQVNRETFNKLNHIQRQITQLSSNQPKKTKDRIKAYKNDIAEFKTEYKKQQEAEKQQEEQRQKQRERTREKAEAERQRKEEKRKKKEEQEFKEDVWYMFDIFRITQKPETIPESCLDINPKAVAEARRLFIEARKEDDRMDREYEERKKKLKEAQEYVYKNQGVPSNYHKMDQETQKSYNQALKQYKEGTLKEIVRNNQSLKRHEERLSLLSDEEYENLTGDAEEGKQRASELLENKFYYADELTPQETSFLIKFYDYKKGKISLGDGFKSVIFHKEGRETDKHYLLKQVIARVHPESKVEYSDKWGNEIDILFTKGREKIAVEVETGTNKTNHTIEKISKLRKRYSKVIVVTNRKHLPKYKVHKDNTTVFVETPKNAIQKVQELIS